MIKFYKRFINPLPIIVLLLTLVSCEIQMSNEMQDKKNSSKILKELIIEEDVEKIDSFVSELSQDFILLDNDMLALALNNQKKLSFNKLLSLGFNPTITLDNEMNLIQLAIEVEDKYYLEQLLNFGANPNQLNKNSRTEPTPLYTAIMLLRLDMVKLLVNKGADVEFRSYANYTPMMTAADLNQWHIVHFLIESGANPFSKDDNGNTIQFNLKNNGYDPDNELSIWRDKVLKIINESNNY